MKSILLHMMILATAMSPVFGQKQLPASIQPYAVNWGYSVKQMFGAAGYDVPGPKASFELKPTIETRSEEARLDSTITYSGYDLNLPDSMPMFRNVYTYPVKGMQVVTEYFYDFDHWAPLSRTALISDELGRLVAAFSQVYDDATGTYIPDSQLDIFPHENSLELVDSFFVSGWSVELNDWVRLLGVWNTIDGAGRVRESLSSNELFGIPLVFLDRYYYNNDGDLSGIESFNIDGEEEYPASRESYLYEDHLLQSATTFTFDGIETFVPESRIEYTYTPFREQELVKSFVIDPATFEWVLNHVLGYAYDDQERVTLKEEVSAANNGGFDRHLNKYTYFTGDDLATDSGYSFNTQDEEWVLEDRTYYFYNGLTAYDPVDPDAAEALTMWPNPSSGSIQIKLDEKATVSIYALSGQLVGTHQLSAGQNTLDMTSLPAGIYEVRAVTEDAHYAGRLVLQGQ